MSPSIRDLFIDPELASEHEGEGETDLDIDKLMGSVDEVLQSRGEPASDPPEGGEQEPPESEPAKGSAEPDEGGVGGEPPAVSAEPAGGTPPTDPFLELPPERRAALLALDEAVMADPAKRAAVFGVLSGEAPVTSREEPRVEIPPDIEPGTPEHLLWERQVEQDRKLDQLTQATHQSQLATEQQRAHQAAQTAGAQFATRYQGKLEQSDILEIAQRAGISGVAAAFAGTEAGKKDPIHAFDQALEHVLWTNETFRTKVIGEEPVTPPGETPEAKERKRKLSAVSSAASPVSGPGPKRSPAETGPDGRLTEGSRSALVRELASNIARRSEGTF